MTSNPEFPYDTLGQISRVEHQQPKTDQGQGRKQHHHHSHERHSITGHQEIATTSKPRQLAITRFHPLALGGEVVSLNALICKGNAKDGHKLGQERDHHKGISDHPQTGKSQ